MLYYAIVAICFCLCQATEESPRIIIVGSGAAGIAAASRLLQNGFRNVTILEAENRIGGRVYTTEFAGNLIDLGGQWVHGEEGNVAYDLAWPLGLIEHSSDNREAKIYSSSGETIPDDTATDLMRLFMNVTENGAPDTYLNESIGCYLKHRLGEYFENHSEINTQQRAALENMLELMEMSADAGDSWFDVSVKGLREFTCKGDRLMNWKDKGYGTILDILMKKIPNPSEELPVLNNTVLNIEVSQINYNASGGPIRVVGSKGDEYSAEHVIVTTSLGVLKADHETLFNPPLTEARIKVIKGLEFGAVAKIYLAYDEPWWTDSAGNILEFLSLYWTEEDKNEIATDSERSWMLGLFGFHAVEHKPKVLCAWMAGPHAREMEKIPENRVLELTKDLIRRSLGKHFNITEPTAMLRSQWFSNKHFRGTYSYRSLETERSGVMARDLSEPITENGNLIILFAGEATSPKYFSTVHGAIESGWREADRLIKHYSDKKSRSETTSPS